MPDLREKSRGYSPETDLRPLDELVRASNAGELYRLMREKLTVGEIHITDRLHSSVIPGIFEDRKNKTRPVYAREMTLLPQTFEQRQAALEIRSTIGEMMVKARTAAAYDLAVETLQTSDRFPGLSHRIIPTKVRAVVEKDGLKQLEEKIEALEKKYSDRLYPTPLVRAAREELIILESRGVDITEQLISDTFRSYLGQSPFLPASRKPPELKRIKRESNKRGQESHLESQAARSSSSPDSSYHIRSLTPIINRSASIITLASITIPMVACVSNQTEKPVLAVTPSGTDYQPDQTEQTPPSGNGETQVNDTKSPDATVIPTRPDFSGGAGGQYSPEQVQLISESAFQQQETMLRNWIVKYWGSPEAQNRPFLPEAVDMRFIYFFDRNSPENALVALQPGGDYGSRIFYLPIKDGQFMQVPPETPEEQFFIPPGFGPLEISGGEIQLGVVDGKWVRVNETGVVQENLNMDTAQWEKYINFESANWAEDDAGNIDPDILYPIVGSVHNANKRTVDLTDKSSGLKLAVILGEETNMEDANLKQNIADQLNNQEELKKQIEEINNQLSSNDKANGIVVINGEDLSQAQITQVVVRWRLPVEKRYAFENGMIRLVAKEQWASSMAPLSVQKEKFIRTDTGKPVMLRGAQLLQFGWSPEVPYLKEKAMSALDALKEMGGNYVVIQWNSGFVDNPAYLQMLVEALEYAKDTLGFRVQLDLIARGLGDPNDPYSAMDKQIKVLDEQVVTDWKNLLKDPVTRSRIGRVVDIYNIISEPLKNADGTQASISNPVFGEACTAIREAVNNSNAICGKSPRYFASDPSELLGKTAEEAEVTINLHPYLLDDLSRKNILDYAEDLQKLGYALSVGEFGWWDFLQHPDEVNKQIDLFTKLGIPYSFWGLVGGYNSTNEPYGFATLLLKYEGDYQVSLSPVGKWVQNYWKDHPIE